jgi:serine/threonine protein phosphatase 1
MRHIVIGDVHGCLLELTVLLSKIRLRHDDIIIFLGDLIHKGPASSNTVAYIQDLYKHFNVQLVLGNHEEKHLRWLKQQEQDVPDGERIKHTEGYIETQLSPSEIEFISSHSLIAYSWPGFTCVHAGIPSSLTQKPPTSPWSVLNAKTKKTFAPVLRVRFETSSGKPVHMGEETSEDTYWAEKYDGRFGHVFFGHHVFYRDTEPRQFLHATGLDLGCVHGGKLVAAIINKNQTIEYVSVQGKNYSPIRLLMTQQP